MHFGAIRNYVFYRSGNTDVATDIAQETFLKIWEKRFSIQSETVKSLLYKIASDLFVSYYRKEKRSFNFFNHFVFDEVEQTPEDLLAFEQLKGNYKKALEKLPEKQRTVFLMSRVESLKYTEIAEILQISVKTVEKRMQYALKHLRTFLNQE